MLCRAFAKAAMAACLGTALLPAAASAQSAITGLVKDSTGGVLPGVTVEATSPALIEKVRTVVTDAQGRYAVVDQRAGLCHVPDAKPSEQRRDGHHLQPEPSQAGIGRPVGYDGDRSVESAHQLQRVGAELHGAAAERRQHVRWMVGGQKYYRRV